MLGRIPQLLGIGAAVLAPLASAADALSAPQGFQVSVFHSGIGPGARHLVVRDNGDVLVARRDGRLIGLRDADGDGVAEVLDSRELPITTGMALGGAADEYLYFSDRVSVSRVALNDGGSDDPEGLLPRGDPEPIVSGFPEQGSHADKALVFDDQMRLYVNVGAPSNACQKEARSPGSPGLWPCPQLERQGALWRYPAGARGLEQADGERFVTGVRNVVALDFDPASAQVYFVMHGRDQLDTLWPDLFGVDDNERLPAEELHVATAGADYGWPRTYVDPDSGQRMLAPEYGGDGSRQAEAGRYRDPLLAFPAHWAPNDLVFYQGERFPTRYRGGAFIAWHGSWNRAPKHQAGYRVSFVPFADGAPAGPGEDFLTGFEGPEPVRQPGEARFRPSGLAVGPDGVLYVSDSREGRIWRVDFGR